jgi:hypothetical protein
MPPDCHQQPAQAGPRFTGPLAVINPGDEQSLADTPPRRSGHVTGPDGTDSQADSAGSIPVTRSSLKAQVNGRTARPVLTWAATWPPYTSAAPGVSGGFSLGSPLRSEIVRPRLDADHLDEAFSALEVAWVGRI